MNSFYQSRWGSRMWSIKWWHCRWPWVTPIPPPKKNPKFYLLRCLSYLRSGWTQLLQIC